MISKKDINQYIDKANCLASWGGNDLYEFKFVPEKLKRPTTLTVISNGTLPSEPISPDSPNEKKVSKTLNECHMNIRRVCKTILENIHKAILNKKSPIV